MGRRWEERELFGERISTGRLGCGLPLVVLEKPGFVRKHASFAVGYGSLDTSFESPATGQKVVAPDGVAHFLEHTLFEGRDGSALEGFSRRGAYVNAGTSHQFTFYHFTCAGDFAGNLRLLMDFVRSPHITEEGVRKERGIIAQEIRMYEDNPDDVRLRLLLRGLFREHPIRCHIAGTVESISRITSEILLECYGAFYRPENMLLCAVGDLDRDEVLERAEEEAARAPAWCALEGRPRRAASAEPPAPAEPAASRAMPIGLPKVALGFKEVVPRATGAALLAREVATDFVVEILFGRSGEAFRRLLERRLVDESYFAFAGTYPEVGFVAIGGDTPQPEALVGELRAHAARAGSAISEPDFERARRKFMGEFIRRFNSVEFLGTACVVHHVGGVSLADVWGAVLGTELEAVRRRADELLRRDASAVATVLPAGG